MTRAHNVLEVWRTTPWKVLNELRRYRDLWLVWLDIQASGVQLGGSWKMYGRPIWQIHRGSTVQFGVRTELRSSVQSNPLAPFHPVVISTRTAQAVIQIGDDFGMTGGSIVAAEKITIGDRVMIGANSVIMDTDFHPLAAPRRRRGAAPSTAPVHIGNDVFIGTQVIILKGSRIGDRTVIGANSVVVGTIPADVIAAGNPAKVIGK